MPKSEGYVSPSYLKMMADYSRKFKNDSFQKLGLSSGDVALDIGCGPAIDTIEMGKIVGDSGKVIGLDMDEDMIQLANKEAREADIHDTVTHQVGTVQDLSFPENTFDKIRAERLFQVIPCSMPRKPVFHAIKDILKPDGVFMVMDTDWATASVDYPDSELERRLLMFFATQGRPDGFAGRRFLRQFKEAGFRDIQIDTHVFTNKTIDETPFGNFMINMAVSEQVITAEEGKNWLEKLNAKVADGTYYSSVNYLTVFGKK